MASESRREAGTSRNRRWGELGDQHDAGAGAGADGEPDPVRRLHVGCRAYVDFGLAAPARYRAMFSDRRPAAGERAFGTLVDAIAACVAAGRSASRDPRAEAGRVWTALHGVVTLRAAAPGLGWPDLGEQLHAAVGRLALLDGPAAPGRPPG
jgi:hypothetical protein